MFSNTGPVFSGTFPSSVNVHVGKSNTLALPAYSDPDGDAVSISVYEDTKSALPAYATFSAGVFTFSPTLWSQAINLTIDVSICDWQPLCNTYNFSVNFVNQAPYLSTPSITSCMSLKYKQTSSYSLQSFSDPDGDPATVTAYQDGQSTLPPFTSLSGSTFTFYPNQSSYIGNYTINVKVCDGGGLCSNVYQFCVNFTNSAPAFAATNTTYVNVHVGQTSSFALPSYSDPDGDTVTFSTFQSNQTSLPSYVTFASGSYTLSPILWSQAQNLQIIAQICDWQPLCTYFTLNVTFVNQAPIFINASNTTVIALHYQQTSTFTLPAYSDPDGDPVSVTTYEETSLAMPSFATFNDPTLTFKPTSPTQLGTYKINAKVCDYGNLCSVVTYVMVTFANSAPVFAIATTSLVSVHVGQTKTFTLPLYSDPDGDSITFSTNQVNQPTLPSYASYASGVYTFTPTNWSQIQDVMIVAQITDWQPLWSTFIFTVSFVNHAPTFYGATNTSVVILRFNKGSTFTLPSYGDIDNDPLTVYCYQEGKTTLPSFVTLMAPVFLFVPTSVSDLGIYKINAKVCDGQNLCSATMYFTLNFTNSAPTFVQTTSNSVSLHVGQTKTFTLPAYSDPDGDDVTISTYQSGTTLLPSFATFDSGIYTFSPQSWNQTSNFNITAKICDWQPLCSTFNFTVKFVNAAPVFAASSTNLVSVKYNQATSFTLPAYSDPDGDNLTLTTYQHGNTSLPDFAIFAAPTYVLFPTLASQLGLTQIDAKTCDGGGLCGTYSFNVSFRDQAPTFTSSTITNVSLHVGQTSTMMFPSYSDADGDTVTVSTY